MLLTCCRWASGVLAYNPKTHKMEWQPILHVWINQDHDLVDLTITTTTKGSDGKVTKTSEVIHTNQKHPFFTMEHGFMPVGKVKLGMHVLRADGRIGVATEWKVVPGTKTMYNLEVAWDHTFTVGAGQWVVHNCASGPSIEQQRLNHVKTIANTSIPDLGAFVDSNLELMTNFGSTDIDLLYENGLLEVGGPMKSNELSAFGQKMQRLQSYAQQEGIGSYFFYDASTGPISPQLQAVAEKWGADVISFILPPGTP